MVVKVLDIVPACNTAAQGALVADRIRPFLLKNKVVVLSFEGVSDVPSSFVNASIVGLINELTEGVVAEHLRLSGVTSQIASMIRRCIANSKKHGEAA